MKLMGNYISCSGVSVICFKNSGFTFSQYQTHYDASIQIQRGQDSVMSAPDSGVSGGNQGTGETKE